MATTFDTSSSIVPQGSPFQRVLAADLRTLPPVLRDHYLVAADTPYRIVLEGTMDRIWHRPAWLRPFFWLLTWADLLFPETGAHIPATMIVTGRRTGTGQEYQTWDRTFAFPHLRHFNAVMVYNPDRACVVEHLGPAHILHIAWDIRFQPPAAIEIVATGCALYLGRLRISLPRFLYPSVRAVETAVLERNDTIHIDLTMTHTWLGPIFGYAGTFVLRREPIGASR
jgi:hypothetical protein